MIYYKSEKQRVAFELWNVATGGHRDSPATAFAGAVASRGAPKYIPIHEKDFTAGNAVTEEYSAVEFLEQWAKEMRGDEYGKEELDHPF